MSSILELEQRDIELQLQEISLKRRQIELEREKISRESKEFTIPIKNLIIGKDTHLHYSNSVKDNYMKIADVCPDGSIMIHHGKDSCTVSKKYSMKSLLWIKQKLPQWVASQREETNFWRKLAIRYSKRFLPSGETISHTTMEKLCYVVDSGKADKWFGKYESLKLDKGKQVTLEGGVL